MSCIDCLRLFLPIYPTYEKPIHDLEELVIINNDNTTEKTNLKESYISYPRKRIVRSKSEEKYLVDPNILDEEELIYERKEENKIFEFTDTELLANQKLKKKEKNLELYLTN